MVFESPEIVAIKRISDPRGNLAVVECGDTLPFSPSRCYWINDVPCGERREGHACRKSRELIVALAGSFHVTVTTAIGEEMVFILSRPDRGLLVPPLIWRELHDFTTNSVGLVIASSPYSDEDYIRDRNEYETLCLSIEKEKE